MMSVYHSMYKYSRTHTHTHTHTQVTGAVVAVAPPSQRDVRAADGGSSPDLSLRTAGDGFSQAGAALRALLREKQPERLRQDAAPRQAHGHGSPSPGGLSEPQGTFVCSGLRVCEDVDSSGDNFDKCGFFPPPSLFHSLVASAVFVCCD